MRRIVPAYLTLAHFFHHNPNLSLYIPLRHLYSPQVNQMVNSRLEALRRAEVAFQSRLLVAAAGDEPQNIELGYRGVDAGMQVADAGTRVSPNSTPVHVTHQEDDLVADTPHVEVESEADEQVDVRRRLFATLPHREGPHRIFGRKPIKDFFTSYNHETQQGDVITRPLSVPSSSSGAEYDDVSANRAE